MLPEARTLDPSAPGRIRRAVAKAVRKVLAAIAVAALFAVVILCIVTYDANKREECAKQDGIVIEGIARIKLAADGSRLLYVQEPGSNVVTTVKNVCAAEFVVNLPAGRLMWATEHAKRENGACTCSITYYIRSAGDPSVE
jgi:hypothetical protein